MTPCPNEETLAYYVYGLLFKKECEEVDKHLTIYDRCRKIEQVTTVDSLHKPCKE